MAEDKNNNGIPDDAEVLASLFFIVIILTVIGGLIARVSGLLDRITIGGTSLETFWDLFVSSYLPIIRVMSVALSLALIVFIIYVTREVNKVIAAERLKLWGGERQAQKITVGVPGKDQEVERFEFQNKRWERVVRLINSQNAPDWKLAILESDIMLGEMLDAMGYRGDSIGEQLKQIEKADFTTLDSAWEAHKIRNSIAHEGEEFLITHREAQRVIRLFEDVFIEFRYI